MPCTDGGVPYETDYKNTEAMLCAIMRAADKAGFTQQLIGLADWTEAGVTEQRFTLWLSEHRRADAAREEREKKLAERERQRREALAKLTPEERRALGV